MPCIIILMTLLFPLRSIHAAEGMDYTYFSSQSVVSKTKDNSIRLKTKRNTFIDLYLDQQGRLELAQGMNLNRGDIFNPGKGLLDLTTIEQKMISQGEKIYGKWRLIKYQEYGWVYQVNVASKKEQSLFYLINAYSAQLIGTISLLPPLNPQRSLALD